MGFREPPLAGKQLGERIDEWRAKREKLHRNPPVSFRS